MDDDRATATPDQAPDSGNGNVPLILLTVFASVFILDWAQVVFIPLVLGVIVSYALSPVVDRLERMAIPRAVSAGALLLVIVGGLGAMAYALQGQTASMIESFPEAAKKIQRSLHTDWAGSRAAIDKMQKAADQIERATAEATAATAVPRGVTRVQVQEPALDLRGYLWTSTLGMLGGASLALVVLCLAFFLLVSGDGFRRKLIKLSGPTLTRKKITLQVLNEIAVQIQRYLGVQVLTSVVVGLLSWLGFWWIGLENAAVWGVVAGLLNLLPYVGALITMGGTALMAILQFGDVGKTLAVVGVSLVIHTLVGNLLAPWLTGRASRMNVVVVFAGILFWGWLWGAWGLLLGLPIMMVVKAVCDHVEDFRPVGEFMGE